MRPANKLEAWLTFIASDSPEDIMEVVKAYPEFRELYREVFEFRYQRRELITMYSEALRILDANTVELMVEQQKRTVERQKRLIEKQKRKAEEQRKKLKNQKQALENQKQAIEDQKRIAEQQKCENEKLTKELERLRALLKEKGEAI